MLHVWGPRRAEIIFYDNGGSQLSSIGCRMAAIVIKGYIFLSQIHVGQSPH